MHKEEFKQSRVSVLLMFIKRALGQNSVEIAIMYSIKKVKMCVEFCENSSPENPQIK